MTPAQSDDPAILIVGDDVLAERVCVELAAAGVTVFDDGAIEGRRVSDIAPEPPRG